MSGLAFARGGSASAPTTAPAVPHSITASRLQVAPGHPGLPQSLLRHLVESRYSAQSAGSASWAWRDLDQLHAAARSAERGTIAHTRWALDQLESSYLVESDGAALGRRWRATDAGARSLAVKHRQAHRAPLDARPLALLS